MPWVHLTLEDNCLCHLAQRPVFVERIHHVNKVAKGNGLEDIAYDVEPIGL